MRHSPDSGSCQPVWRRWARAVWRRPAPAVRTATASARREPREDDELLGARDAGVEQVALQHHPRAGRERDDDGGVLAALRPVDRDRVGVRELVQFVEVVVELARPRRSSTVSDVVLKRDAGDHPDGAVEDARRALVVVVPQLGHLVADPEHAPAVAPFGRPLAVRGQRLLERQVQVPGAGRARGASGTAPARPAAGRARTAPVSAAPRCPPPAPRSPPARREVNQKKSAKCPVCAGGAGAGGSAAPALIRCALTTMPDCWACRKILVSRTTGSVCPREQVAQHLAGADRGQLVHVPDQQQVRPRRYRLDQLVGQDHVDHRGLVHDDQVGVEWRGSASNSGLPARPQLQQAVDGGRFVAGQFGQPLGGAAGRGGQHDLGSLGPGQRHDRTHREALPAARPAGQHRDP